VTPRSPIPGSYRDAWGRRRRVPARTRALLAQAAGAADGHEPVLLGRPGMRLTSAGELTLEDGTALGAVDGLPRDIPIGYHRLATTHGESLLLVAPPACPLPAERQWGWSAQLYATRSSESWGIGDLADLRLLGERSRSLGAGLLLVNPLSATAPRPPVQPSPYFPTSRRFRSPLYLRVTDVPGAASADADALGRLDRAGHALNGGSRIDRDAVLELKLRALELVWDASGRPAAPLEYSRSIGPALQEWSSYAAIAERHGPAWRRWPEPLRSPRSPAVNRFRREHAGRVAFHEWIQWLIDQQLASAAAATPLVHDLPIGVDRDGADAWAFGDVLANQLNIGAPPDVFNPAGQDWGMPPFAPDRLRAAGHRPFIESLRAAFRHAGGLRIDHVMGIFRLWCLPLGASPAEGGYLRYPWRELLAVVNIEANRAGAFVIGEDLGTIDRTARRALAARRVLSYRLAYFERTPPADYPRGTLAAVTTHDLPTIAGCWSGAELKTQARAGLRPDAEGLTALRARLQDVAGVPASASVADVVLAAHSTLSRSPALLVTATLEDAMRLTERPNLPGTVDRHPNWSVPLPVPLEQILEDPFVRRLAAAMRR
jgi:4-alpha-glucanotransferase